MRIDLVFAALLLALLSPLEARVDVRPPCFRELERHFFTPQITQQALSLYAVRQSTWPLIVNDLKEASQDIPQRDWARGQRMSKNPLDTFYDADQAAVLLRAELLDTFREICLRYDFTNQEAIDAMFLYIEQQQASKIQRCFGRPTLSPEEKEKDKT